MTPGRVQRRHPLQWLDLAEFTSDVASARAFSVLTRSPSPCLVKEHEAWAGRRRASICSRHTLPLLRRPHDRHRDLRRGVGSRERGLVTLPQAHSRLPTPHSQNCPNPLWTCKRETDVAGFV